MLTANMSAAQVADFIPPPNSSLISILNPNGFIPKYPSEYAGILAVCFHDINEPQEGFTEISDADAETIARFINIVKKSNNNLYVHCSAGICRSGAIVEVLLKLGWEIDKNCPSNERRPNMLVYNKVRKACGLLHSWEQ